MHAIKSITPMPTKSPKSAKPYSRKNKYFYVHSSVLAYHYLAGRIVGKAIPLHTTRPNKGKYHRVIIQVIRTPKEQAKMDAKYRAIREKRAARLKKKLGF